MENAFEDVLAKLKNVEVKFVSVEQINTDLKVQLQANLNSILILF